MVSLPEPRLSSATSVEEALRKRRSVREYTSGGLTLAELGQLLWAAYGVTRPDGKRTAPSARELYPLRVYALAGSVDGLEPGLYRYEPASHSLELRTAGDLRSRLYQATFSQGAVLEAPAILVFSGLYALADAEFGAGGRQYVHMDLGHAGENVHLQAVALGLGTVVIGAFRPAGVQELLQLPEGETPLYLMPVGRVDPVLSSADYGKSGNDR
jgi:SagB-type dehydrogenase family enzyme